MLIASQIGYFIRQSVVGAVDALRTEPQTALAVRANAVYHDGGRGDQIHAHVRENVAPHDGDVALDGHQSPFLHFEFRADNLDVDEIGEVQVLYDVTQLAVHYTQRRAPLNVQLVHSLDRNVHHDEMRDVYVGELFFEVLDERVLDRERIDSFQVRERVVRYPRYPADVRELQQFHAV